MNPEYQQRTIAMISDIYEKWIYYRTVAPESSIFDEYCHLRSVIVSGAIDDDFLVRLDRIREFELDCDNVEFNQYPSPIYTRSVCDSEEMEPSIFSRSACDDYRPEICLYDPLSKPTLTRDTNAPTDAELWFTNIQPMTLPLDYPDCNEYLTPNHNEDPMSIDELEISIAEFNPDEMMVLDNQDEIYDFFDLESGNAFIREYNLRIEELTRFIDQQTYK